MRNLHALASLALLGILASCSSEPTRYELVDPADSAQVPGALLAAHDVLFQSTLEWIPGTERVAFVAPVSGRWPIMTVDAASGLIVVVDSGAVSYRGATGPYFREIVAAPDGRALYYVVGIGNPGAPEWVLRVADPAGGGGTTLRSSVWDALAVSANGDELAYVVRGDGRESDSLIVRTVADGSERYYADYDGRNGRGGPILFSPDGTELLYGQVGNFDWPLRRLSLADGTGQTITLPEGFLRAQLFHWGASGLAVLAEYGSYPTDYRVLTLSTGVSVQVGTLPQGGEVRPYESWISGYEAWSRDGSRVAYWTGLCLEWDGLFDCGLSRYALHVADARTGTRARVAYVAGSAGPAVFSPDGRRIVYHNREAKAFYVVDVP